MRSMKGSVRALLVLACLLPVAAPAAAERQPSGPIDRDGIVIPRTDLIKTAVTAAGADLDIYSEPHVDVERLLEGVNAADANDAYRSISANRERLYGNAPLVVVGKPAGEAAREGALLDYYFLWDDKTFGGQRWFTPCKNSSIATMFVAVLEGELDFSVKRSKAASYSFFATVTEGNFYTYSQTAKKKTDLGYSWYGFANYSQSHIIVYCYK